MEIFWWISWGRTAIGLTNEATEALGISITIPFIYSAFLFFRTAGIAIPSVKFPALWVAPRISSRLTTNFFIRSVDTPLICDNLHRSSKNMIYPWLKLNIMLKCNLLWLQDYLCRSHNGFQYIHRYRYMYHHDHYRFLHFYTFRNSKVLWDLKNRCKEYVNFLHERVIRELYSNISSKHTTTYFTVVSRTPTYASTRANAINILASSSIFTRIGITGSWNKTLAW